MTSFFKLCSTLGSTWFYVILVLTLVILKNKKDIWVGIHLLIIQGMNRIIKALVKRPRPPQIYHLVKETNYSFPSGHSMSAMIGYGLLVLEVQKRIIADYKNDIAKYASKTMREKARECFESIPDQLAKENKKFQYKILKNKGTSRTYANSLGWIIDAGLGIKVHRLKTFDIPLKAYRDPNAFKFYLNDTGLLLAFYKENVSYEIINGNLGVFKGGIFENVIAQCLINNDLDLYYYQKADYLEIDFVTYMDHKIVPIEVKSSKNTKAISLKNLVEKEKLDYGIVLSTKNLDWSHQKIKYLPLYMVMFIKQ